MRRARHRDRVARARSAAGEVKHDIVKEKTHQQRSTDRVIATLWCSSCHPAGDIRQPAVKCNQSTVPTPPLPPPPSPPPSSPPPPPPPSPHPTSPPLPPPSTPPPSPPPPGLRRHRRRHHLLHQLRGHVHRHHPRSRHRHTDICNHPPPPPPPPASSPPPPSPSLLRRTHAHDAHATVGAITRRRRGAVSC